MEVMTASLVSGLSSAATTMMSVIGEVVPVVIPVMGAIAVVGIGIRIFKKVTGR